MKKETIENLLNLLYRLDDELLDENEPETEQEMHLLEMIEKEVHDLKDSLIIIKNIK